MLPRFRAPTAHESRGGAAPPEPHDLQAEGVGDLRGDVPTDVAEYLVELVPLRQLLVGHAPDRQKRQQRDAEAVEEEHVAPDLQEVREILCAGARRALRTIDEG